MINVGLIGAGRIARVHARAITSHAGSTLAAVSDVIAPAAESLAQDYGTQARDLDAILGDPNINAVLIASSTDTHADLIEAATDAGKAVLCEKPVDLSLARARDCLAHADKTGMPVMVGLNRRFDPSFGTLKSALDAGRIGAAELLCITSYDPAPPPIDYIKVSGGMFRDMMIHDFDMAHFLMGALPETVSAVASCLVDPAIGGAGDVDTAAVTMTWGDGRLGVIKNSRRAAHGYDQRIEVLGASGMLQAENMLENTVQVSNASGVTGANPVHFFLERYMEAYRAEWDAFARAITQGTPLPVTLKDGVDALRLSEAAAISAAQGRPVRVADV